MTTDFVRSAVAGLFAVGGALFPQSAMAGGDQVDHKGTTVFTGSAYKENSRFSYVGAIHAFNGDLGVDGFLLRVMGGFGKYDYDTSGVPSGNVEADQVNVDAGIGYHAFGSGLRLSVFAMANYQDHDLDTADPGNSVSGNEWGFKAQGELATVGDGPVYATLMGNYSTAFDSYWARAQIGANVWHGVAIGPEIVALGNEEFDQIRYGAFIANVPSPFGFGKWNASIGWADSRSDSGDRTDSDSVYGTMGSSFSF